MRKRRTAEAFGLSFLDCICCGFGAVILFYTIITAQSGGERARRTQALAAEANRLEEQVLVGTRDLVVLRNTLDRTQSETASAASRASVVVQELQAARIEKSVYDETSLARRERIEKLKADIKSLEEGARRLEAGSKDRAPPGQDVRAFRGSGDRRYVTGLRMRGKHILVLVDASASMLHQDVVSVIRMRNQSEPKRRMAAKWRRAVDTVGWISTQIPPGSQYQVYRFSTQAAPLVDGTAGKWLDGTDARSLSKNMEALQALVPKDGTSLINAFAVARQLSPQPDQIILLTDGLPTQGRSAGIRRYIDAGARARLFDEAVGVLPDKVNVDILLFPMKGDLPAAHRFWRLARLTDGTLMMPSKDWP